MSFAIVDVCNVRVLVTVVVGMVEVRERSRK